MQDDLSRLVPLLGDAEAWERLPVTGVEPGQPLPIWARALAASLPCTAAAMLRLDFLHRTRGGLDPQLRGKMRWVAAHANGCAYGEACAAADLHQTGLGAAGIQRLAAGPPWAPADEQAALAFARNLTLAPSSVTDEDVTQLIRSHGEEKVVAMVLLLAQASFQDLLVLALDLSPEPGGPPGPLEVRFARGAMNAQGFARQGMAAPRPPAARAAEGFSHRQQTQGDAPHAGPETDPDRTHPPRIRVPSAEDVRKRSLPGGFADRPMQAHLHRVCFGYQPELAAAWFGCTRAFRQETSLDPAFDHTLQWIVASTLHCSYCMGHCEMVLPGLGKGEVAGRDWSEFGMADRAAFTFARKASASPPCLSGEDRRDLVSNFGTKGALEIIVSLSICHYFTRVAEAFRLPLEGQNIFGGFYRPSGVPK